MVISLVHSDCRGQATGGPGGVCTLAFQETGSPYGVRRNAWKACFPGNFALVQETVAGIAVFGWSRAVVEIKGRRPIWVAPTPLAGVVPELVTRGAAAQPVSPPPRLPGWSEG